MVDFDWRLGLLFNGPYHPWDCYIYLHLTFTIKIYQMWVNTPYMDGMGEDVHPFFSKGHRLMIIFPCCPWRLACFF